NVGLRNVSPPQVAVTDPLPGYTTALWAAPLLMALIGLLTMGAAVAAVVRRGQAARVVVPPALAAVPVALVLLQPSGHEGGFRAAAGDASKLLDFTTDACDTRAGRGPVYLVLGPAAEDDIRLEGAMDLAVYRGFQQMLAHDDAVTRVFRNGDTTVYRCRA